MIFYFDVVNFPFVDGEIPRAYSLMEIFLVLIWFANVSSHVADFNTRIKF